MRMTTQHFYAIPTSCAILPTMQTTKLSTCTQPIHCTNKVVSIIHSTVFHIKDNPYLPCLAPIKISLHNLVTAISLPYNTAHALSEWLRRSLFITQKYANILHQFTEIEWLLSVGFLALSSLLVSSLQLCRFLLDKQQWLKWLSSQATSSAFCCIDWYKRLVYMT